MNAPCSTKLQLAPQAQGADALRLVAPWRVWLSLASRATVITIVLSILAPVLYQLITGVNPLQPVGERNWYVDLLGAQLIGTLLFDLLAVAPLGHQPQRAFKPWSGSLVWAVCCCLLAWWTARVVRGELLGTWVFLLLWCGRFAYCILSGWSIVGFWPLSFNATRAQLAESFLPQSGGPLNAA